MPITGYIVEFKRPNQNSIDHTGVDRQAIARVLTMRLEKIQTKIIPPGAFRLRSLLHNKS